MGLSIPPAGIPGRFLPKLQLWAPTGICFGCSFPSISSTLAPTLRQPFTYFLCFYPITPGALVHDTSQFKLQILEGFRTRLATWKQEFSVCMELEQIPRYVMFCQNWQIFSCPSRCQHFTHARLIDKIFETQTSKIHAFVQIFKVGRLIWMWPSDIAMPIGWRFRFWFRWWGSSMASCSRHCGGIRVGWNLLFLFWWISVGGYFDSWRPCELRGRKWAVPWCHGILVGGRVGRNIAAQQY